MVQILNLAHNSMSLKIILKSSILVLITTTIIFKESIGLTKLHENA
jgi:hypothetical protein